MLVVIPQCKRTFQDFGMKLPASAELAFSTSDFLISLGLPLLLLAFVTLVVDGFVMAGLYGKSEKRVFAWMWFLMFLAGPVFATAVAWQAVMSPMVALMEGLSQ